MAEDLILVIRADGSVEGVHSDELEAILRSDPTFAPTVVRASHVEPAPTGGWTADMGPSGGPVLGPYRTRGRALTAERRWLREHKGL